MESVVHPGASLRRLHPSMESVEFAAQSLKVDLSGTGESIEFFHRTAFCTIGLRDKHHVALNGSFARRRPNLFFASVAVTKVASTL